MERLSPIGWALRPLKNYAKFSGRASRAEFWWFFLFAMLTYFVIAFLFGATAGGMAAMDPASAAAGGALGAIGIFVLLFWLALFVPILAVQVRRLHDTNRSGWWLGAFYLLYLIYFIVLFGGGMMPGFAGSPPTAGTAMLIGVFGLGFMIYGIVLIVFYCMRGTEGPNRYGDDPYGANVAEVFA